MRASRRALSFVSRSARAARAVPHGALVVAVCLASARGAEATGAVLSVRLTSALSSNQAKPGDRVDAVTIAPLVTDNGTIVPPGCHVSGRVTDVGARRGLAPRAWMDLTFDTIVDAAGQAYPATLRVDRVDNAVESVTEGGRITASGRPSVLPNGVRSIFMLAANDHPAMLAVGVTELVMRWFRRPRIAYDAGTEMTLTSIEPIPDTVSCDGPVAPERTPSADVLSMVDEMPWRTQTLSPPKPADVVNLLILGDGAVIDRAFKEARWTTADPMSLVGVLKMFGAMVGGHTYHRAPVSRLNLEGAGPQLVFQKQNATLEKRHHVRIWPTSVSIAGRPVWLAAATHDVAVRFTRQTKLFAHRADPNIDDERLKIVNDLTFAGEVEAVAWVPRPDVEVHGVTGSGDAFVTDGRLAVVWLKTPSSR